MLYSKDVPIKAENDQGWSSVDLIFIVFNEETN